MLPVLILFLAFDEFLQFLRSCVNVGLIVIAVVVSAGGPTALPPGISAALSPSGTSYQLMLQRPELHLQHMASAVAVGVPDIQQTSTGPILHNKLPSPANHTGRVSREFRFWHFSA